MCKHTKKVTDVITSRIDGSCFQPSRNHNEQSFIETLYLYHVQFSTIHFPYIGGSWVAAIGGVKTGPPVLLSAPSLPPSVRCRYSTAFVHASEQKKNSKMNLIIFISYLLLLAVKAVPHI
jgi:hypothetical protein